MAGWCNWDIWTNKIVDILISLVQLYAHNQQIGKRNNLSLWDEINQRA